MVQDEIPFDNAAKKPSAAAPQGVERGPSHAFVPDLAAPLDRLAAVVADLVLFLPVVTLAIAPFRRQALVAQLMNHEDAWSFALMSATGAALIVLIAYQTFFISTFGATPGKLVLGLRVRSIWDGKNPHPMAAFLRSLAWCAELLLFGVPWISAYANERRRPFHDRLGDTAVVAVGKRRPAGPPTLPEMSLASGAYAALLASASIVAVLSITHLKQSSEPVGKIIAEMEAKGLLCSAVGEAKEEWVPSDGKQTPPRLAIAVALYGAKAIDETCLEQEADFAIWREKDRALAYLAKALAKDDESARESYFDKTCELEHEGDPCVLARLIRLGDDIEDGLRGKGSEDTESRAETALAQTELEKLIEGLKPSHSEYLNVWIIRHLVDERDFVRVLDKTKAPSPSRKLGHFYAAERAHALWNLDRQDEARVAVRSSIETFDADQRVGLSSWLCTHETEAGRCDEPALWSCDLLSASIEKDDQWLTDRGIAAAYIRAQTCRAADSAGVLTKLQAKIPDLEARTYLKALAALKSEKNRDEAVKLLTSLTSDHDRTGAFFFEANEQLVDLARSEAELEPVVASWLKAEPGEEWVSLGHRLVSRLSSFEAWARVLDVGVRMLESDRFDRETQQRLVVAAYRSGRTDLALGFLEGIFKNDTAMAEPVRVPASQSDFESAVRELMDPEAHDGESKTKSERGRGK